MSDIEILLRELNEKIDFLFQKVDILNKKVDQLYIFSSSKMVWNDSLPPEVLKLLEIKDPVPNPYEIKC